MKPIKQIDIHASLLFIFSSFLISLVHGAGTIGDQCVKSKECDQDNLISCNPYTRRCDCVQFPNKPPLQFHNGKCISFVGGTCNLVPTAGIPSVKCIEDSICTKGRDYKQTDIFGTCACKPGYFRTINHQCAKDSPSSNTLEGGLEVPKSTNNKGRSNYYNQKHESSARYSPGGSSGSVSSSVSISLIHSIGFLIFALILR